jgi:hypothetical protein
MKCKEGYYQFKYKKFDEFTYNVGSLLHATPHFQEHMALFSLENAVEDSVVS